MLLLGNDMGVNFFNFCVGVIDFLGVSTDNCGCSNTGIIVSIKGESVCSVIKFKVILSGTVEGKESHVSVSEVSVRMSSSRLSLDSFVAQGV